MDSTAREKVAIDITTQRKRLLIESLTALSVIYVLRTVHPRLPFFNIGAISRKRKGVFKQLLTQPLPMNLWLKGIAAGNSSLPLPK